MILFINSFKKTSAIMVGALISLLIVGCGSSYQGAANGGDGIYEGNNANNRAVISQRNTTANSDSYFTKKLEEYEQAASSGDVLTDIEGYSSEYYGDTQDEYQSGYDGENYQAWGENAQQSSQVYGNVSYNYNSSYYPFWNRGYRNNYGYGGYGYGYGYYGGGPFYNNFRYGWGGNLFLYGGFYGGAFFGNNYGYGRGYYNNRIVRRSNNRRVINNNARRNISTRNSSARNSSARSTNNRRVYSSRQSSTQQTSPRQQSASRQSSSVRRNSNSSGQSNRNYSGRSSNSSSNRSYSPRSSSSNRGSSSARSSRRSSSSSSSSRTYRRR